MVPKELTAIEAADVVRIATKTPANPEVMRGGPRYPFSIGKNGLRLTRPFGEVLSLSAMVHPR